jgi:exonuclease III
MDIQIFHAATIYFDYIEPIQNNIKILEKILQFTKEAKLLIQMDSNSRSTTWHDVLTNSRGKLLEEIFASNHLHIIYGYRARTTFQSSRGSRNVDLSIVNNQMLATIKGCEISEEESCWDHKNITFNLSLACNKAQIYNFLGT